MGLLRKEMIASLLMMMTTKEYIVLRVQNVMADEDIENLKLLAGYSISASQIIIRDLSQELISRLGLFCQQNCSYINIAGDMVWKWWLYRQLDIHLKFIEN